MESLNTEKWFPMRVTYGREDIIRRRLDKKGITCFVPMHYEIIEKHGQRSREFVPAIRNLLFVRSTQAILTELKHIDQIVEPLRFIAYKSVINKDGNSVIISIPDKDMLNFMRVTMVKDENVMYLRYEDGIKNKGIKVQITDGPFVGVTGKVLRIKKNRHVVVELDGIAAVAISYVPIKSLVRVEE